MLSVADHFKWGRNWEVEREWQRNAIDYYDYLWKHKIFWNQSIARTHGIHLYIVQDAAARLVFNVLFVIDSWAAMCVNVWNGTLLRIKMAIADQIYTRSFEIFHSESWNGFVCKNIACWKASSESVDCDSIEDDFNVRNEGRPYFERFNKKICCDGQMKMKSQRPSLAM